VSIRHNLWGHFYCGERSRSNWQNSAVTDTPKTFKNDGEKKIFWNQRFSVGMELVRSMIDHRKVLVLALNGPGVGAGAAWFQGVCDLFYAAEGAWLQVTFSNLGLVPENGSAVNWAQSMGVHRANDW
jgi:Delta3-Delta2-enoyl-CoA isomerase